jgi:pimeloyl-ACP methyl ester carboxylesterase
MGPPDGGIAPVRGARPLTSTRPDPSAPAPLAGAGFRDADFGRLGVPDVPGVTHRFVDAGGLRMHVAEAGEGDPIVMLHGWPQHWYLWRDVIPLVAPHARLICPDLRGFGWTDVPSSGYDRETMARDVLALLDALELERVRLVGHDWGGWIGFLLCLNEPRRISRFVALSILPPWPSGDPRDVLELWRGAYQVPLALPLFGRRAVHHGAARLAFRAASDAFDEGELDAFTERLKGERAQASERLYRTFLTREALPIALGRYAGRVLEVPTLLLVGERDFGIPQHTARKHAAETQSLELELVGDASHFVVDERPELVADRILRFFAKKPDG